MQNEYDNYKHTHSDINECTSRGACSIAPNIASLQEIIIYFLKQLAYYVIKLENIGANNPNIKYEIINDIASLVSINEFSEKQLFEILSKDYFLFIDAKNTYHKICKEKNIQAKDLKNIVKFDDNTTISRAISQGEKLFLEKYKQISQTQKNLMAILQILVKSTAINLIKLCEFKEFDDNIYHYILSVLDMFNHGKISNKDIKTHITKLSQTDCNLQIEISDLLLKAYNGIEKVEVSHSTRKGKAILVSGNNFQDLLKVLEATKEKNIDVYTHSNLLITHALNKFHKYPHLLGHYGNSTESCILDFATFPGSILLTKNSKNNTEYLYRGRLFSNDYIIHKGVIKVENDDYSELISAALNSKGFSKGKTKPSTIVGYNEKEIDNQLNTLVENLKINKIKHLYIVGLNYYSEIQNEYFKELFENLKQDEFVLSFSYKSKKNNVLTINVGNYNPLVINILKKLFAKYPISSKNISFFFTKCDVMTISNIVMLKSLNAKNIFMAQCPPTLVNPSVFETFKNLYNINTTESPVKDLKKIKDAWKTSDVFLYLLLTKN